MIVSDPIETHEEKLVEASPQIDEKEPESDPIRPEPLPQKAAEVDENKKGKKV